MTIDRSAADRYRPSIQRRDRRWELHAGARRFAIVFSDTRSSAPVATFQVLRRAQGKASAVPSLTKMLGVVLGLLGGAATVGIAIQSGRADAGAASYVVRVPVPERSVAIGQPVRAASPVAAARPRVAPLATPPAAAASEDSAELTQVYHDEIGDGTEQLGSRKAATTAAMTTGTLQQWVSAGGDERGFIVAGPVQDGCRDLSILVRRFGGEDRVEKSRECARVASN